MKRSTMREGALLLSFGIATAMSLGAACSPKSDGATDSGGDGDSNGDGDSPLGGQAGGDGDGDSSGDGDIDVGSGGNPSIDECAEGQASAELVPANLLFVVDKSGSMNCNPPPIDNACLTPEKADASEDSKWQITQRALTGPEGALPTLLDQEGVSVGLLAFPTDDFCAVPEEGQLTVSVDTLTESHLDELTAGLSLDADGQTPLAGAAIRGLAALRAGIDAGDLRGNHYLVVMTDGAETCQIGALAELLWYVEQAHYYYGIKTYAIGAPGSEASRALLSELSILGGTRKSEDCKKTPDDASESCHIDLTESTAFAADLGAEFEGITQEAASTCEYDVPEGALIDRSKVNVQYTPPQGDPQLVPQDPRQSGTLQCEGADGWQFTPDGNKIVLCGDLCDSIRTEPDSEVRVIFGCRETVVR